MNTLESALYFASKGLAVLPLYGIRDGECACGKDCSSPGKHPTTRHGVKAIFVSFVRTILSI